MNQLKDYTYIGCVNGWPHEEFKHEKYGAMMRVIEPDVLKQCKAQGHSDKYEGYDTPRGYHKTWCNACQIWWDMDSGD